MSTYTDEVLADAPSYWWRLTEASGPLLIARQPNPHAVMRGLNVVMGRGVADDDGSIFGGSMTGARAYVVGASSASFVFPAFTWECWFWLIGSDIRVLGTYMGDYSLTRDGVALAYDPTDGWSVTNKVGGAYHLGAIVSHTLVGPREWHCVHLTYDGATFELFVDALSHGTRTEAIATAADHGPFGILSSGTDNPSFEGAYAAEPAIYDYVLSGARIAAHFAAGSSAYGPAIGQPLPNPSFGSSDERLTDILASVRRTFA